MLPPSATNRSLPLHFRGRGRIAGLGFLRRRGWGLSRRRSGGVGTSSVFATAANWRWGCRLVSPRRGGVCGRSLGRRRPGRAGGGPSRCGIEYFGLLPSQSAGRDLPIRLRGRGRGARRPALVVALPTLRIAGFGARSAALAVAARRRAVGLLPRRWCRSGCRMVALRFGHRFRCRRDRRCVENFGLLAYRTADRGVHSDPLRDDGAKAVDLPIRDLCRPRPPSRREPGMILSAIANDPSPPRDRSR